MRDVVLDPDDRTVTATRSLRSAGRSLTITMPPQVLDAMRAEEGDDLQLVAHMDTGVVEMSVDEDDDDENGGEEN